MPWLLDTVVTDDTAWNVVSSAVLQAVPSSHLRTSRKRRRYHDQGRLDDARVSEVTKKTLCIFLVDGGFRVREWWRVGEEIDSSGWWARRVGRQGWPGMMKGQGRTHGPKAERAAAVACAWAGRF